MVSSRKRGRQEMEATETPTAPPSREPSTLDRLRNMWQFANLAQWIFLFGKAVKIEDDLDIEDLEMECLKPNAPRLSEIGLALLKFVSSHRGLTPEIFDEYTRRQYIAKAPERNPFGTEEEPAKFLEFDVFTKIRVLQQLTQWTMVNPDRIRERMEEQKDADQTYWRVEPFGWDADDRTYFVLDDNRLYRQTEPPPPAPVSAPPKKNSKKAKAALRASKRRKLSEAVMSDDEIKDEHVDRSKDATSEEDGFGGMKWECVAITLDQLNSFIASIEKTRDPNEKALRKRITEDLLPLLEKQEESRKRKEIQKQKELLNMEKLATAKRSSRIAGRLEQQKQEEESRDAERKRQAELVMAKKEQEKWLKLEKERESRMMTREQRLKEREARRILHEEELASLSEDSKKLEAGDARLSERHLKAEIERKKQALEELALEDGWVFDCICGAYGQVDDGTHSIACEKCNVWQHTACAGISEADAARDDFHFVCKTCLKRTDEEERAKNRPHIKIKLNQPASSASPATLNSPMNGGTMESQNLEKDSALKTVPVPQAVSAVLPQQSPSKAPHNSSYANGERPLSAAGSPRFFNEAPALSLTDSKLNFVGPPSPEKRLSPFNGYDSYQLSERKVASPVTQHAFSSPRPYSPTSLPPPHAAPNYATLNGNPARTENGHSFSTSGSSDAIPSSPGTAIYTTPVSSHQLPGGQNGPNQANTDQARRRSSMTFPSPLAGAPILMPSPSYSAVPQSGPDSNNGDHRPPTQGPATASTASQACATPVPRSWDPSTEPDPGHLSALPPPSTGMSPTKHSPPRPTTANGVASLGLATPSVLPPVASLSPSPQQQDLTPPVKPSDHDRARAAINQNFGL